MKGLDGPGEGRVELCSAAYCLANWPGSAALKLFYAGSTSSNVQRH